MQDNNTNITPSLKAAELSREYSVKVSSEHKKSNGQFFTPVEIAEFMAKEASSTVKKAKVLDPGCGTGILSCSLIEALIKNNELREIELHVYETDKDIIPFTHKSLSYLKQWLSDKKIKLSFQILEKDFIEDNAKVLQNEYNSLFSHDCELKYDYIISNPPYYKISKEDKKSKLCNELIHGQPNVYSLFLGISAHLLSKDGELIYITPRSFASGEYFRKFRNNFFKTIEIHSLHLFNSRNDAFKEEKVLQENIILKAKRKNGEIPNVKLSVSNGLSDINNITNRYVSLYHLIDFNSKEKLLYLPINENDEKIIDIFKKWKKKLIDFGIQISTGPVVPFRAKEFLNNYSQDTVPLFWLINTSRMRLNHPKIKKNKPQWIKNTASSKLLIRNSNYVFLRRFSAKDDKSRLVACPYFSNNYPYEHIGIENHLNYIYRIDKTKFDDSEIIGLSALLNSTLFDSYFRTFNGNTQVSATELRQINFPDWSLIKNLGEDIKDLDYSSQEIIDNAVNKIVINGKNRRCTKDIERIGAA